MQTIYFVRHGEAQANAEGLVAGSQTHSPLTIKGADQARAIAQTLKDKPIDLIVASPLERTTETAEIIARAIGYKGMIQTNALIIERDFGSATGLPKAQGLAMVDNGSAIGVEPIGVLESRMQHFLEWLRSQPAEHILVVGHGGSGLMLRTIVEGGNTERFYETASHDNGELYVFTLG